MLISITIKAGIHWGAGLQPAYYPTHALGNRQAKDLRPLRVILCLFLSALIQSFLHRLVRAVHYLKRL